MEAGIDESLEFLRWYICCSPMGQAARVSKSWVVICEDTPEETVHWKGTRGRRN